MDPLLMIEVSSIPAPSVDRLVDVTYCRGTGRLCLLPSLTPDLVVSVSSPSIETPEGRLPDFAFIGRNDARLVAVQTSFDALRISLSPEMAHAIGFYDTNIEDGIYRWQELFPHLAEWPRLIRAAQQHSNVDSALDHLLTPLTRQMAPRPELDSVLEAIADSSGAATITEVARTTGVAGRSMERITRSRIGFGPKRIARLVRARTAMNLIMSSEKSLSAISAECGFSDQSHLTREIRWYSGLTPLKARKDLRDSILVR